jgi:hypothetical protein
MSGRAFAHICALLALLAAPPLAAPARAWGGFTPLQNTPLVSDLSCASEAANIAVCAAVGPGSRLLISRFDGTKWGNWVNFQVVTSAPSCSNAGTRTVICAARDTALGLVAYQETSGTFTSMSGLAVAGSFGSAPSCAPLTAGGVLCAARSTTGLLAGTFYSGGAWMASSWKTLKEARSLVYSPVSCTADNVGDVVCGWVTTASGGATRKSDGTAWGAEVDLSGAATNPLFCTEAGVAGAVGCFASGISSGLYFNEFNGGTFDAANWSGWDYLGGEVHGYGCAEFGLSAGKVNYACGVTAVNSSFYTNEYNGSSWSGFALQGTATFIGNPSCIALNTATGQVMCVVLQENGTAVSIVGP